MAYIWPIIIMLAIVGVLGIILALVDYFLATYGPCNITLNKDKTINVIGGNSLLYYLFENKIFIPSACGGRATCGFCKVKIAKGGGLVLPTEMPFLSKKELKDNVRISCQVKVKSDIEVFIPEELLFAKEYKTVVEEIQDLTYDMKLFRLKLLEPDTINFKAGQYVQFQIPKTPEFRAYSIASVPGQKDFVDLIVRLVPEGLCTTYMFKVLKKGDTATVTGPYGNFYLREESQKEIVCVAGGSGVAPIKCIIYHLFEKGTDRKVTYFFGARQKRDLFYVEEFRKMEKEHPNFKFIPALSVTSPEDNWTGDTGFIHLAIPKYIKDFGNVEGYLCGPPPMIDAAVKVLTTKGVKESDIYFDKF
ncbi:MAG TPA: NADH:ubiquinone reductase (Na(+)-transporting) subunit F [Candidatus Brocadiia bacterium]|nr:2Fe-2S iron-sulfur cluster binding domain-containing protein [Candidatus Brocadiales bacterium]